MNFFPQSFHSYILCLYLTYSIFFSFMTLKIIIPGSILMSFPANYVMYILTVFLLIDFSLIMDIFLLLFFFSLFFFFFFIFVWGIIVLVSAIQQHKPFIRIHMSPPSRTSLPHSRLLLLYTLEFFFSFEIYLFTLIRG